jgi:hypothetical protein
MIRTCFISMNFAHPLEIIIMSPGCLLMKCDFYQAPLQNLCHSTGQQSKRAHLQHSDMHLGGGQFESTPVQQLFRQVFYDFSQSHQVSARMIPQIRTQLLLSKSIQIHCLLNILLYDGVKSVTNGSKKK